MSRLRLFSDVEFAEVREGDTVFRPRKMLQEPMRDMRRQATVAGELDIDILRSLEIDYMLGDSCRPPEVPGWSGLLDARGNEIEYAGDLVGVVIAHLPISVTLLIQTASMSACYAELQTEGNSSRSSSKPSSEDPTPSPS